MKEDSSRSFSLEGIPRDHSEQSELRVDGNAGIRGGLF